MKCRGEHWHSMHRHPARHALTPDRGVTVDMAADPEDFELGDCAWTERSAASRSSVVEARIGLCRCDLLFHIHWAVFRVLVETGPRVRGAAWRWRAALRRAWRLSTAMCGAMRRASEGLAERLGDGTPMFSVSREVAWIHGCSPRRT